MRPPSHCTNAGGEVRLWTATGRLQETSHETNEVLGHEGDATDYETTFGAIASDFSAAVLTGSPSHLDASDIMVNSEACVRLTEAGGITTFC